MDASRQPSGDTWAVLRQDDHGNQFVVSVGLAREEAERLAAELTARAHKQLYWIEAERPKSSPQLPRAHD